VAGSFGRIQVSS